MPKQKTVEYVPKPRKKVLAKLRELEATHEGWIAAVEPQSGELFVGRDILNALNKAEKAFPDRVFDIYRIGYKVVYNLYKKERGTEEI